MDITIELDKNFYYPNEEVTAKISLNLKKPTEARGIFASLTCTEKEKIFVTRHIPRWEVEEREKLGLFTEVPFTKTEKIIQKTIFFEEKKIADKGTYQYEQFKVKFKLPPNAPFTSHTFGDDNKIDVWILHVKIDIPFAFDINAEKEVIVKS